MSSFTVKLPENSRTLKSVTFPDGTTRNVQYMRDGIITFADGRAGGTYERQDDSVVITPMLSFSQAADAASAYLKRVGRL